MQDALRRVVGGEEYRRLAAAVASGRRVVSVAGLTSAPARALALAALQRETARRFAVLVAANRDMEAWEHDLSFWCAAARASCQSAGWDRARRARWRWRACSARRGGGWR